MVVYVADRCQGQAMHIPRVGCQEHVLATLLMCFAGSFMVLVHASDIFEGRVCDNGCNGYTSIHADVVLDKETTLKLRSSP